MGTAIEHHVPDRVKPSFVIFHIRFGKRCFIAVPTGNIGHQRVNVTTITTLHSGK